MSESQYVAALGDMVLFYDNPFEISANEATMGWICKRPGQATVTVLCLTDGGGWSEKPSVRPASDPYWANDLNASTTARWGCYQPHPQTLALRELVNVLTQLKIAQARTPKKSEELVKS